jgi:hypothetical protein
MISVVQLWEKSFHIQCPAHIDYPTRQTFVDLRKIIRSCITAEGSDGPFSGTITTTQNGNTSSHTESVAGSVKADGTFTLTTSDPITHQAGGSLAGTASATTLSGTFDDGMGGTGPFTLMKQ